jgi:hypothetical protein
MGKYKHPLKNASKTLSDSISKWCYNNIETFDEALVVGVSKYADRLVDVQPLAVQVDEDGVEVYPSVISECPVILQGNADGFLNFPLRVGDKVKIGYPKESAEEFVYGTTTEQYIPVDTMKWNNRQAFVLGYASQVGQDHTLSSENFEIRYFLSRVTITPDNRIVVNNPEATFEIDSDGFIGITNGETTFLMYEDGNVSLTNPSCALTMNTSGDVNISNGSGNIILQASGDVNANGATINTSGNVITAGGADLDQTRADLDAFKTAYIAHGTGSPNHPPPAPF